MIRLFRRIFWDRDEPLNHIPVQADQKKVADGRLETPVEIRGQKVAQAKAKYGKPFAHERHVERDTEPSVVLADIQRRAEEERRRNGRRPLLGATVRRIP
jgi:hypothetical protein